MRKTPRNSAITRQYGSHSNNKLGRDGVGTLTSHWQPIAGIIIIMLMIEILLESKYQAL